MLIKSSSFDPQCGLMPNRHDSRVGHRISRNVFELKDELKTKQGLGTVLMWNNYIRIKLDQEAL